MVFLLMVSSKLIITTRPGLDIGQFSTLHDLQLSNFRRPDDAVHDFRAADLYWKNPSSGGAGPPRTERPGILWTPKHKSGTAPLSLTTPIFSTTPKTATRCWEDINLDIHSGEVIGIVGGTGSGKSSLVQLIPRLYDVTDGAVAVGAWMYAATTWKPCVPACRVLQKNLLFSGTMWNDIRWGNLKTPTDEEVRQVWQVASPTNSSSASPTATIPGLSRRRQRLRGQKQRICIARPC